jgi:hypothetical protein
MRAGPARKRRLLARLRHAVMSEMSLLLDEQRTTFARGELFRV